MDRLGAQLRIWVLFGWMYLGQVVAEPHYMVAIPAILHSGAEMQCCASLFQPNESMAMTVTLSTQSVNSTLFQRQSAEDFHKCFSFLVPVVPKDEVQHLTVEVIGNTFYSREVRKVQTQVNKPVTFIQTDKPIYLPGQTVHFRVVSLDTQLRPTCRKYDIIELEDVNGNRIGQWLNQNSEVKILQLSYPLISEAKQGTYQISVTSGEDRIFHNFKVEKYVLPKFDVKITADDEVVIEKEQISVKVCSKYTYGQPVPGIIKIDVCRPLDRYLYRTVVRNPDNQEVLPEVITPCYKESKEADSEGCYNFTVPMSTFTSIDKKAVQDNLEIVVKMEEEGTGITFEQHKRVDISYVIGKLSFFETPKVYEKDYIVDGRVKAVRFDGVPLENFKLSLFEGERWSSHHVTNLTTDSKGEASFSFDTTGHDGDIRLHVTDKDEWSYAPYRETYYATDDIVLSMSRASSLDSKTVSSLEVKTTDRTLPCGSEEEIFIQYTVVQEAQDQMEIMYLVVSNNGIVNKGVQKVVLTNNRVNEGSVSFKLNIDAALAPDFAVVAFAILRGKFVIAHSADFNCEKCFGHKVGIEFKPPQGVPGEDVSLYVSGHANSLCGISVIDQSVLIQEPGKHLTAEKIYNLLPGNRHVPYNALDPTKCLPVRPKRSRARPVPESTNDAFSIFQRVGLKIATNLMIQLPECLSFLGREYHHGRHFVAYERMHVAMAAPNMDGFGGGGLPVIETVRTFFPETWIWDLVETGPSGTVDVPVKVPDTITTWETEAFCLSSQGFGLAPRKEFTVFQPFFLELSLPYSIIRGENFELKATVFNYLKSCIMVVVTPAPSDDYTLTPAPKVHTFCLCGNERHTVSWGMAPSALGSVDVTVSAEAVSSPISCNNEIVDVPERGRIDRVTKQLIVKAEGIEVIQADNLLLCPSSELSTANTLTEIIEVKLPENTIDGSARALVSVIGNILGRAMKNLDGLLRMPYGCGEQNMVLFAPNIYIMDYLTITNQLTPEVEEKAKHFLTSGYQRQLNYKHHDGAYSAFGTGSGNTWLTAFVLRCFARASKYIFIDPANIELSRQWLESKQKPNGCFEKVGNLFHKQMKGGVSDEVTLTGYISAAFLEMGVPLNNTVLNQSLNCLRTSDGVMTNTYTTALLSYVFSLANDTTYKTRFLSHLDTVAHRDDGLLHWSQTSAETSASLSVEMSSYVLMATLGSPNPTAAEQGYATRIIRWLVKQQNYYGGFTSTQDTVVALQALTRFSTVAYSPGGQSTVTVSTDNGAELEFQVNQDNRLLYQEQGVTDVSKKYTVEAKGNACAAIQITTLYNIPVPQTPSPFHLRVRPEAECNSKLSRQRMTLKIEAMYKGKENASNMVVIDIKMLSAFSVDRESLNALKMENSVSRVDQDKDHVLIYLDEAKKNDKLLLELMVIRESIVHNLKSAVVEIYDYYQPDDRFETQYTFPCQN